MRKLLHLSLASFGLLLLLWTCVDLADATKKGGGRIIIIQTGGWGGGGGHGGGGGGWGHHHHDHHHKHQREKNTGLKLIRFRFNF